MPTKQLAVLASLGLGLAAVVSFARIHVPAKWPHTAPTAPTAAVATTLEYAPGATVPVTRPASPGQRTYESTAYRFALEYPEELSVEEYAEADDAMSVVFRDPTTGKGFQVYVTPYSEPTITDARFALDQPSGVRENERKLLVDGVRAIAFDGKNAAMGDTAEVWIVHNGFLYEIATYRQFEAWLQPILETWQFI